MPCFAVPLLQQTIMYSIERERHWIQFIPENLFFITQILRIQQFEQKATISFPQTYNLVWEAYRDNHCKMTHKVTKIVCVCVCHIPHHSAIWLNMHHRASCSMRSQRSRIRTSRYISMTTNDSLQWLKLSEQNYHRWWSTVLPFQSKFQTSSTIL
jgi:hypothetical protein